jgi:hypothetical protein
MGYYNYRVFGSPSTLAYQTNRATYAVAPVFVWESPRPEPAYRHRVIRDFFVSVELRAFQKARTLRGFFDASVTKVELALVFFFGAVLAIPLLMFPLTIRDRRIRFLLVAGASVAIGVAPNAFMAPHYLAPIACILSVILLQCMRHMRLWRPGGQPVGLFLVRVIPALCVVLCVVRAAEVPTSSAAASHRAKVQQALEKIPGRQLAIVRYSAIHDPMSVEWVYNAADIDSAKVIWAREMTPELNRELIGYFMDRTIWLVEPDSDPPKVSSYGF